LYVVARAKEEIVSLSAQCRRYITWHIVDLYIVTDILTTLTTDCQVRLLLNSAQLAIDNLRPRGDLQVVLDIIRKYEECGEEDLIAVEGFSCIKC
jgi:hypothetical protein